MNKSRLAKTIGFLVAGAISFVPLIFLKDIIKSIAKDNVELVNKIGKAVLIMLGIIFLAVGIYNLVMIFTEEESLKSSDD